MANSLFSSILSMLDTDNISRLAGVLGQPEQSILKGLQSSIAVVLGGLASKSEDPGTLRKILDLAPNAPGTLSNLANDVSDPNSSLIAGGKRVLSALFGASENAVTSAVSAESGLRPGITSTLMAMAAPMVMSLLGKRMRDEGMSITGLGSLLQRESAAVRNALPAGLSDLLLPRTTVGGTANAVVAQAVEKERSSASWLVALALAAVALGVFWFFTHARRPMTQVSSAITGSANRAANEAASLGDFVRRRLPTNVNLYIPERGVETQLLAFIQNPEATPNDTTWFEFDRLQFETGSARLRPESQEQINNIAAILAAYPNVHLKVGGYTDNVGSAEANLQLSRDRANSVVAELVGKGVSPDRLVAEGYGEQYPLGDNATEEGRARNRRVAMRVTQK